MKPDVLPLLVVAWAATLLGSSGPHYVASEIFRINAPLRLGLAQIAILSALLLATLVADNLRPLAGYLLALIAYTAGNMIVQAVKETDLFAAWAAAAKPQDLLLSEAFLRVIPALLMLGTVVGSDIGPRQLFLAVGDVQAPTSVPFLENVSWRFAGPVVTLLIALPFLAQLAAAIRSETSRPDQLLTALPVALLFAVVNAAGEEFRFRVVPLARLEPVVGASQALLLSAALFGIGHYRGHPSGLLGVVGGAFVGWLWGRSMLDTRGLLVPWASHGVQDVIIFATVAIARR